MTLQTLRQIQLAIDIDKIMIEPENFQIINRIAKGGYGEVFLAKCLVKMPKMKTNELVAIKLMSVAMERAACAEIEVRHFKIFHF